MGYGIKNRLAPAKSISRKVTSQCCLPKKSQNPPWAEFTLPVASPRTPNCATAAPMRGRSARSATTHLSIRAGASGLPRWCRRGSAMGSAPPNIRLIYEHRLTYWNNQANVHRNVPNGYGQVACEACGLFRCPAWQQATDAIRASRLVLSGSAFPWMDAEADPEAGSDGTQSPLRATAVVAYQPTAELLGMRNPLLPLLARGPREPGVRQPPDEATGP